MIAMSFLAGFGDLRGLMQSQSVHDRALMMQNAYQGQMTALQAASYQNAIHRRDEYAQTLALLEPYRDAGRRALEAMGETVPTYFPRGSARVAARNLVVLRDGFGGRVSR